MSNQLPRMFDTDAQRSRSFVGSTKKATRRTQLNTSILVKAPPPPLPKGYDLEEPKLFVDMIAVTMDVECRKKEQTIWQRIKDFDDHRVVKQYMPNYCKGSYHNTFQFTVSPKMGGPFVLKVSHSPIDAHLENGKRRSLRVEFNPSAVGAERMWILRKILCRLLGKRVVARLFTDSVVTRLDLALDFEGVDEALYLFKTNARTSSIYHGEHSETQYLGGKRSRVRFRWYDKACESAARGRDSGDTTWFRLEADLRDLRCSPARLAEQLSNPFAHVLFFSADFLDDRFSINEGLEEKFRDSVRERSLNATFQAKKCWLEGRERYLAWLEDQGHQRHLFDSTQVWGQLDEALAVLDGLWEDLRG